jgi:hypothetical protein
MTRSWVREGSGTGVGGYQECPSGRLHKSDNALAPFLARSDRQFDFTPDSRPSLTKRIGCRRRLLGAHRVSEVSTVVMSSDYARQKFYEAALALVSSRPIQERLTFAALPLVSLRPDDLPEEMQGDYLCRPAIVTHS